MCNSFKISYLAFKSVPIGISSVESEGGRVFFGEVGERTGDFRRNEIGECRLMKGLPDDLNYPEVEYLAYMRTAPPEIRPKWV